MNSIIRKIIFSTIFILPFFILQNTFYPMVFSKSLFFEGATLIIAIIWIIDRLYKKEKNTIPKNIVFLVFGIYILLLLVSGFNSFVPSLSFWGSMDHGTGVVFMLSLFLFSIITSTIFKKIEDWYQLFTVFVTSGILFTLGSLLSQFGVKFSSILNLDSLSGFLVGNSSWVGIFMVFVFFISLGLVFSSKIKSQKIIGIVGMITSFFDPTLTGFIIQPLGAPFGFIGLARAGSYSLFIGIGLFVFYLFFRKIESTKWRKIFIGSFIILSIIGIISASTVLREPIKQFVFEKAGGNRLVFWDIAKEGFKEKPIIGWGTDSYQYVYAKYFDPIVLTEGYAPEYWVDRAHNIYFDELVSGGITSFVLLMLVYGIILFGLVRNAIIDRGKEGFFYMALFCAMVSFLIQGLMIFQINIGWFIISIFIAFVANFGFKDRSTIQIDTDESSKKNNKKIQNKNNNIKNFISGSTVIVFCILFKRWRR